MMMATTIGVMPRLFGMLSMVKELLSNYEDDFFHEDNCKRLKSEVT